jgi:vancomycin permeability regulator SanA
MGFRIVDSIKRLLKIFYDNEVVVSFSNNNKSTTLCRHMELKYNWYEKMIVDPFTKENGSF